jgi:hypothetical protein
MLDNCNLHKKIMLLILVLHVNLSTNIAQTKNFKDLKFERPEQKAQFYAHIANKYNVNAFSILSSKNYKLYTKWADGIIHYQVLSSFGTVVHETCHSVNADMNGFNSYGYFISPVIKIIVSKSRIFKSNEINRIIPLQIQAKIFRYRTYINGNGLENEISSVKNGIYGIMEEFDAYYQGARAVVELFDYYNIYASSKNPYYWALYISNCQSIIYAYYEFRLFIAWYLRYAKNIYPEIYNSIMSNRNLMVVFSLIDKEYEKTVEQYFINRKIIIDRINKDSHKKASISGKFLLITDKKKTLGYGIPDPEIRYLKSLFIDEDYALLKKLTIHTINEKNYMEFLD